MSNTPLQLGAVLYPGFEMLDLFGPLEMFSMLGNEQVNIHTIAEQVGLVPTAIAGDGPLGPKVQADFSFADAPALDMLLLPGGFGTFPALENPLLLDFLRDRSAQAKIVASVCTGSALLAKAGLLDGLQATSNKQFFDLSVAQSDAVIWVEAARWVEAGKFFTSSGVSAGMDMSIAIITKLFGEQAAAGVLAGAEYTWHQDSTVDPFVSHLNEALKNAPTG
jgi:putative intracellular protease/amidase